VAGATSHDDAFAVTIGARAVFDAGSLPLPSAGVGPVLGFQFGAWRIAADATFWLPRLASGPDSGSEAQICLLSAALHGCYLALQVAEQLGLEPCVAVEAGVARGHGVNVLDIAHPSAPWAAVFAGSDAPRSTSLGRFRERKLPGRDTNGGWGHTWHGDTAQQWSTQIRSVRRTPNRTCRSRAQNSRASILNTSALYGGCCRAWVCLQAW
jgi:hypothetical protein